ncbi:MAG: NUDIX hydrolase [Candidatus Nomurabacteria bacterium]|nr:NUDIX hydrolase [Candidatus Nomurabacteria bacterium]
MYWFFSSKSKKKEIEDEEKLILIEKALKRLNGVNVIIEDEENRILVGRATYGDKLFMLPGGGIDRGELPMHAAMSEVEEEFGVIIQEQDLELIAYFIQRLKGVQSASGILFLFKCNKHTQERLIAFEPELEDIQFMSVEEIFNRQDEFGLAYKRMILAYLRIKAGFDQIPKEGRLSETVEYTHNNKRIAI